MSDCEDSIPDSIKNANSCSILAHVGWNGNSYNVISKNCHLGLLSGIIGEQITADKLNSASYSTTKNGVTVTVHFESHPDCTVTSDDVDSLVLFIPVNQGALHPSYTDKMRSIDENREEPIWNNAIVVLTGVDESLDTNGGGNTVDRLEAWLDSWRGHVRQTANSTKVNILLAGRLDRPDLPKPHEKWFSKICFSWFQSLKLRAMPAMLKYLQGRISNSVSYSDIQEKPLHQQPFEVKEGSVSLSLSAKLALGIGGGGAIAGAAAAGATTGALIGALAIGIPTFGIAAGLGLLIGGVVGGGAGAGIAGAAVGGAYVAKKNQQQQEIWTQNLRVYYAELLTRMPKIRTYLTEWEAKQTNCRILVAGIHGEGVNTLAASIARQHPQQNGTVYERILGANANVTVHSFLVSPSDANREAKAKQLAKLVKKMDMLVFCIPMTSLRDNFVNSKHATFLQRLSNADNSILSNTVLALTHANELRGELDRMHEEQETTFQQFFEDQEEAWRVKIRSVIIGYKTANNFDTNTVPILPCGNVEPSIDLSQEVQKIPVTQFHWHPEFLLQAMAATKPEGLPALIRINKARVQQQRNEYRDIDVAQRLIVEAQCSMFRKIGLKEKKDTGEAIGVALGAKDE